MGNCQIEFFDIEGERYFSAYTCSGSGEHGAGIRETCFKLKDVYITSMKGGGYQLIHGKTTYKFTLIENKNQIKGELTQYLFKWLPYQRFKGNLSHAGLAIIKREFDSYISTK